MLSPFSVDNVLLQSNQMLPEFIDIPKPHPIDSLLHDTANINIVLEFRQQVTHVCLGRSSWNFHTMFKGPFPFYVPGIHHTRFPKKITGENVNFLTVRLLATTHQKVAPLCRLWFTGTTPLQILGVGVKAPPRLRPRRVFSVHFNTYSVCSIFPR